MIKNERIENFKLKVQNKSILIFYITRRKTDRKPSYQYCYSYIDVEVNPKRRIPSGTRIIDAYDVNDFKERLSKLFTKALKKGLPEHIIPEEIFAKFYPQLVDSEYPSKSNEMSTISIYYRNLITKFRKHFCYRASRYKRTDGEDIRGRSFGNPFGTSFKNLIPSPETFQKAYQELVKWNELIERDPEKARDLWNKRNAIFKGTDREDIKIGGLVPPIATLHETKHSNMSLIVCNKCRYILNPQSLHTLFTKGRVYCLNCGKLVKG